MFRAGVAHLVERNLAKVQVVGSRPITRSKRIEYLPELALLQSAQADKNPVIPASGETGFFVSS